MILKKVVYICSIICIIIAIVFMAQSNSTFLSFSPEPNNPVSEYFSYFNIPELIGYGNIHQLFCAIFSVFWLIFNLSYAFIKKLKNKIYISVILGFSCTIFSFLAIQLKQTTLSNYIFIAVLVAVLLQSILFSLDFIKYKQEKKRSRS